MLTALERGKTPSEAAYCIFIPYDVCDLEQNRALKIFNIGAQPCIRNRCFQVLIYFDMATFVGNEAHRFLALRLRGLLDRDQWHEHRRVENDMALGHAISSDLACFRHALQLLGIRPVEWPSALHALVD